MIAITALNRIKSIDQEVGALTPISEIKLDSLDTLEWFMEIEKRLGIELDLPELAHCRTISEIASWIVDHKKQI